MWHVVVSDKSTKVELARYSFKERKLAYQTRENVFESRVKDNRENVRVELIYSK